MIELFPIRKKYVYETLERVDDPERGRRYGDQKLPSVTTILSATKDKSGLDAWAERVGRDNAERIKNEAATVGTHMHNVIERIGVVIRWRIVVKADRVHQGLGQAPRAPKGDLKNENVGHK